MDENRPRRGVASALYDDIERRAPLLAASRLACEVNGRPCNEVSMVFHERRGFGEVRRQDTDGGTQRVCLMIKPLAPAAAGDGVRVRSHPE